MPQLPALFEDGKVTVTWGTRGAVLSLPKEGIPPDSLKHLWIPEEGRGSEAFVTLLMLSTGHYKLGFFFASPQGKKCRGWMRTVGNGSI